MRLLLAVLTCLVTCPVIALAQAAPDFSTLPLNVGDKVYVTDPFSGVVVSGPVRTLTPTELAIDEYVFTPKSGLKIERSGDPIWDGTAIGAGIGALAGITIGAEGCLHQPQWHCVASGSLSYAVLGAIIDFFHKGRTTVYRGSANAPGTSMHLVPEIGPRRKAITLALGF